MEFNNCIERDFYERTDVVQIAKELLGCVLVTNISGKVTAGRIVETEAYAAVGDKACHAHLGKFTKRTKTMFEKGGTAYVYLCYGIHNLFNVVCNKKGIPEAVLIRALEPVEGTEIMLERRGLERIENKLTGGPGILSCAMGITKEHNGTDLCASQQIYICRDTSKSHDHIPFESGPRVGIAYAEEDALLPWRFWIKNTKWKSPAK
ncbi:MAG: DNA-3-methyladenine glycosylase [Balneolales bacterium]|nr:DNA-3-methyladenine glycosylase [Balneolales bacterium]